METWRIIFVSEKEIQASSVLSGMAMVTMYACLVMQGLHPDLQDFPPHMLGAP
jgi:hypothetical protein